MPEFAQAVFDAHVYFFGGIGRDHIEPDDFFGFFAQALQAFGKIFQELIGRLARFGRSADIGGQRA